MLRRYRLIPLVELKEATQLQVLKIRNEEYVRNWMFTEKIINEDEHFSWIEQLKNDKSQICLIVIDDNTQPFGAVTIKRIDRNNMNAELGFYRSQNSDEKGLMSNSLSVAIDYSFGILGLEKIYSEVFEGNIKSINLHKKLLFIEEGFMRSHIIKDGKRIGVYLFGLLKSEWKAEVNETDIKKDIIVIAPPPPINY